MFYTANLAAFLTVKRMDVPIKSADDLAAVSLKFSQNCWINLIITIYEVFDFLEKLTQRDSLTEVSIRFNLLTSKSLELISE